MAFMSFANEYKTLASSLANFRGRRRYIEHTYHSLILLVVKLICLKHVTKYFEKDQSAFAEAKLFPLKLCTIVTKKVLNSRVKNILGILIF